MADRPVIAFRLGDRVRLRKPHPCGSRAWGVVRIGADIGLVCEGCGRRVLLGDDLRAQRNALVADGDRGRCPATIDSTSVRGLPQNEQRIDSADRLGPGSSSGMARG